MSGLPLRYPPLVVGLLGLLLQGMNIYSTQAAPLRSAVHPQLVPFSLSAIKLTAGSQEAKAAELNAEYLRMLEPDSLLWTFRNNAGLPTPGTPYWKSWEDPTVEVRGQFTGHYLSASALWCNHTGEPLICRNGAEVVRQLKEVQDAIGNGYLSAFPQEHFDRLEALQPVWAPYYVIHKILAGLLDQYLLLNNKLALSVAQQLGDFFVERIDGIIITKGDAHWQRILENEFGGMSEAFTTLHTIVGDAAYLRTAQLFVKASFFEPLVAGRDVLEGLHANTHLAQVNGFAAHYERTGDPKALAAVTHFFYALVSHHSYATGGSSDNEFWGAPDRVADAILKKPYSANTQETCTMYNVLKLARSLYRWTGDSRYADWYERGLLNGILGTQRVAREHMQLLQHSPLPLSPLASGAHVVPSYARSRPANSTRQAPIANIANDEQLPTLDTNSPGPGVYLYMMPLGAGVSKGDSLQGWGYRWSSLWCCYGTAIESFSKLADSIFFHVPKRYESDPPTLMIARFADATLDWKDEGVNITMHHDYHSERNIARITVTVQTQQPDWTGEILVRCPGWAKAACSNAELTTRHRHGNTNVHLELDYDVMHIALAGPVVSNGTVFELELCMPLTFEGIQDSRPEMRKLHAIMKGPLVMAGLTHGGNILANKELGVRIPQLNSESDWFSSILSPDADLLSLSMPGLGPDVYVRHDNGLVYRSDFGVEGPDAGDTMDASFRAIPVSGPGLCSGGLGRATNESANRSKEQYLGEQIVLEAMGKPGSRIGVGWPRDQRQLEHATVNSGAHIRGLAFMTNVSNKSVVRWWYPLDWRWSRAPEEAQTFVVRPGLDGAPGSVSLELLGSPGVWLSAFTWPDAHEGCIGWGCRWFCRHAPSHSSHGQSEPKYGFLGIDCRRSYSARSLRARTLTASIAPMAASVATAEFAAASSYSLQRSLAKYPKGVQQVSRLHDYVIAPLNGLVDERYTVYFDGILDLIDHQWNQLIKDGYCFIIIYIIICIVFVLVAMMADGAIPIRMPGSEIKSPAPAEILSSNIADPTATSAEAAAAAHPCHPTPHESYAGYVRWSGEQSITLDSEQQTGPVTLRDDLAALPAWLSAQEAADQSHGVSRRSEAAAFEAAAIKGAHGEPNGDVAASKDSVQESDVALGSGMHAHTADGSAAGMNEYHGGSGPSSESSFHMLSAADLFASDEE